MLLLIAKESNSLKVSQQRIIKLYICLMKLSVWNFILKKDGKAVYNYSFNLEKREET